MKWTFWLNIVSPHLSELVRGLASMPHQEVTVIAEHEMAERRKAMGWKPPDCSPARVLIGPQNAEIEQALERGQGSESIHIVGGELKRGSLNRRVLPHLARTGAMVGLMSETADNRGIPGLARKVKYALQRYFVEDKLDFIVAMGQVGVRWYTAAGYDPSRIFPFMYVTKRPVPVSESRSIRNVTDPFRIVFLGQFIPRKDGITAIRAMAGLTDCKLQFDLVGGGPELERWKRLAAEGGAADRIRFLPAMGNRIIGDLLEHADLLLLPSRYDGWGAVVNEALMYGVPVVCSDNCGALDLLREPWRGSTFKMGSVRDLQMVLRKWIESGRRKEDSSARIRDWSSVIEGAAVARYLVEIVEYIRVGGERPSPPWY